MAAGTPRTTQPRPPRVGMWPARRRPQKPLLPQVIELAAIIVFLVISYHALLWYWTWTAPKEAAVPQLVGMKEEEALRVLDAAGLRAEVTNRKASEDRPAGVVLSAEPPPGREVKVGRKVRLVVSSGSRWAVVPDLRDMSVDRARALVAQANLEVGRQLARFHESIPVGYVIAQDPEPKRKLPRGTEVDLVVSKGLAPTAEPVEPERRPAVRSTRLDYVIPPGASLQEVRIVVADRRGERTVYRSFHHPGERISEQVTGEGPEAVARLFVSGVVAIEKSF